MLRPFRVSTGLKDLIGRDLITNDFVAVFELVKNSFDAHATSVRILFEDDRIVITDDGKGMSEADILDKWLFVAYSAKRDGTEDADYRDDISHRGRAYAGAKGVGRFSCDRLGKRLQLSSRYRGGSVQILDINWTRFEKDARKEFGNIKVRLSEASQFPDPETQPESGHGTVLSISDLRLSWDRAKLQRLKRELMKLINPFDENSPEFQIEIIAPEQEDEDGEDADYNENPPDGKDLKLIVNGKVENPVLRILSGRTTSIHVTLTNGGKTIDSQLEDRGELIYHVKEKNPYRLLKKSKFSATIYFLNRSAKVVFARHMGLPSVQFGSIFLFRNGFRVFPIGQEHDDFFGLTHRKQQGMRRYLGSRDLIGRVSIAGVEGFEEATSRDQGLIRTPQVEQLATCLLEKCIRRLERYVVDITWKDPEDQKVDDISRMKLDDSSFRITQLISRLADTPGVDVVEYSPDLVRIVDERSSIFESSLAALELLAEKTGNRELLSRVSYAKIRIKELRAAEQQARAAERRAESRAVLAESKYEEEKERNQFLIAAASLDQDTILNLHHQILMQASAVQLGIKRMMRRLQKGIKISRGQWIDFLEYTSFRNSQIITASRFATKGGYKQQSAEIKGDLFVYIRDYITTISALWAPSGLSIQVQVDGYRLQHIFRPIEVGIVIDNLVTNAAKAKAKKLLFVLASSKGQKSQLLITVADDGMGWPPSLNPIERAFEKGVTTTDGSGLGLYHVKQVVEDRMRGFVKIVREPYSNDFPGAQLALRIPT